GDDPATGAAIHVTGGNRFSDHETEDRAEHDIRKVVLALIDPAPPDEPGENVAREPDRPAVVLVRHRGDREGARRLIRGESVTAVLERVRGAMRVGDPLDGDGGEGRQRISRNDRLAEFVLVLALTPETPPVDRENRRDLPRELPELPQDFTPLA